MVCIGSTEISSFMNIIRTFVFPGTWFSASMVICYALYYIFVKFIYARYKSRALYGSFAVCVACFVILFASKSRVGLFSLGNLSIASDFSIKTPYAITQFIWMGLMLLGFSMRKYPDGHLCRTRPLPAFLGFAASVALFGMVKVATQREANANIEALLPVSYVLFAYCSMALAMFFDKRIAVLLKTKIGYVIQLISKCSLEIYFIQFAWIRALHALAFPVNLVLLVLCIVASAWVLHWISGQICKRLLHRMGI